MFQLHTETFNILSHGGGFIVFAWLLRWLLLNAGSEVQERHHAWSEETHLVVTAGDARLQGPRWPLYIFLIGACTCLLTSAVCHTFACMSQRVHRLIWKLDYAGIVLLISCSFLPPLAFTFLCEPRLMAAYLSAIGIASACTLFLCIAPRFAGPTWRGVRAATFSALGGLGVIPILHQIVHWQVLHRGKDGMPRPLRVAFLLELMMGICYWAGAYIFACRFPEKWFPGKLDLAFNSHNLFHLLVLVGVSTHVEASMILLAWRDRTQCAPVEARP